MFLIWVFTSPELFAVLDVDALLRVAKALACEVVDSSLAFGEGWGEAFNVFYSCYQVLCRLIVGTENNPIVRHFRAVGIIKIIVIAKISTFRITDVDAFAKDRFVTVEIERLSLYPSASTRPLY